jgi:hypothetical protein
MNRKEITRRKRRRKMDLKTECELLIKIIELQIVI